MPSRVFERTETPQARRFALEALWRGGAALILPVNVQPAAFSPDGRWLATGTFREGVKLWSRDGGSPKVIARPLDVPRLAFGPQSDSLVVGDDKTAMLRFLSVPDGKERRKVDLGAEFWYACQRLSTLSFHGLRSGTSRELKSHGNRVWAVALDPKGEIAVTGDFDGVVRVRPVTDEEPHLLYGHRLLASSVAVSPDGRFIASGSQDGTIRVWPMPKGRPFHTLPYDEILARLRSFTNLRVVPDPASADGYRYDAGPFPGWAKAPEW